MRRITSHKVEGVNEALEVSTNDSRGPGGAPTWYVVRGDRRGGLACDLDFQAGNPSEVGVNGLTNEALLAVVIDRLQGFQSGPFSCRENALALTHLEDAMHWLQHRTRARVARGVEGQQTK